MSKVCKYSSNIDTKAREALVEINNIIKSKADLVDGTIPSSQLPSYVDDVLEYTSLSEFPTTGESGKVYVDTSSNITYRWSGTTYIVIGSDLALGETASTAYAGNKGKELADKIGTVDISSIASTITEALKLLNSKSSNISDNSLANYNLGGSMTFDDLSSRTTPTFFTNWFDETNFPYCYGSGIFIPGFDQRDAEIIYLCKNNNYVRTRNINGWSNWKKIVTSDELENKVLGQTNKPVKVGQYVDIFGNLCDLYDYYIYVNRLPQATQSGVAVISEVSLGEMSSVIQGCIHGKCVELTSVFYDSVNGGFCAPLYNIEGSASLFTKFYIGSNGNLFLSNSNPGFNDCSATIKIRYTS